MRAVLCTRHGPPESLVIWDVPSPTPGPTQVVVDVKACGVGFPDTLIIQGTYQFRPELPFSPGCEIAGVVKEVGEGVDSVEPGQRVIGSIGWGGYAEEVSVDVARITPIPASMDFVTAAGFVMNYATASYALADRANLKPGETILVLGAAGGVGLAAVELAATMGARVVAAASSEEKLELCREYGATETINYTTEDLRARMRQVAPAGADVVYDPVGGPYSEPALRSIGWNGRFLVIGFASGEIPRIPLNLPLLKGCSIVGVFWGDFTRWQPARHFEIVTHLAGLYEEGKLRPFVSATYPLERAADALRDMMERRVRGKTVLVVDP